MEADQRKQKNQTKPTNKGLENFARYSGLAFQMIGIIVLTTFGGVQLDRITRWETPVFTIVLSLLGVFAAIYFAIKSFIRKK